MEKIDAHTQARVWERVNGTQPAPPHDPSMLALEAEIAAQLRAMIRYFPHKAPLLRKMLTQNRQHHACLQGMQMLRHGQKCPQHTPIQPRSDPTALVRRCYVNCLKLANQYASAAEDTEYGTVYKELADVKRSHCTLLLTLLGD